MKPLTQTARHTTQSWRFAHTMSSSTSFRKQFVHLRCPYVHAEGHQTEEHLWQVAVGPEVGKTMQTFVGPFTFLFCQAMSNSFILSILPLSFVVYVPQFSVLLLVLPISFAVDMFQYDPYIYIYVCVCVTYVFIFCDPRPIGCY